MPNKDHILMSKECKERLIEIAKESFRRAFARKFCEEYAKHFKVDFERLFSQVMLWEHDTHLLPRTETEAFALTYTLLDLWGGPPSPQPSHKPARTERRTS